MIIFVVVLLASIFFFIEYKKITVSFTLIFLTGFILRCITLIASLDVSNFDIESYQRIGEITLQNLSIYPDHAPLHHPYFPFFLYVEALAISIEKMGINAIIFLKIIFMFFDVGIIYYMYLLSKKNLHLTLLYAVNPITILITYFHGQFDVIPLFFLIAAVYLFLQSHEGKTFLRLSIAILIKTWPILFVIPFFKHAKNKYLIIFLGLFPLVGVVLYSYFFKTNSIDILEVVKNYRSLFGSWGISKLFVLATHIETPHGTRFLRLLFLVSFFIFSLVIKSKNIVQDILLQMLFFFCFTFALGVQYFSWIIPFVLLTKPKNWKWLIAGLTCYLGIYYMSWTYIKIPTHLEYAITTVGLIVWIQFLILFIQQVKEIESTIFHKK